MFSFFRFVFMLLDAMTRAFELFLMLIIVVILVIVLVVCQVVKNQSKKKALDELSKHQLYCRNCGHALNGTPICRACGVKPGVGNKFCFRCGNRTDPLAVVCVKCGVPLSNTGSPRKSKVVAGLLGIFLGIWGVHNFYLGYPVKACAQAILGVFCLFNGILWGIFVASVWGIVEGIMILAGGIKVDGKGTPLKD